MENKKKSYIKKSSSLTFMDSNPLLSALSSIQAKKRNLPWKNKEDDRKTIFYAGFTDETFMSAWCKVTASLLDLLVILPRGFRRASHKGASQKLNNCMKRDRNKREHHETKSLVLFVSFAKDKKTNFPFHSFFQCFSSLKFIKFHYVNFCQHRSQMIKLLLIRV